MRSLAASVIRVIRTARIFIFNITDSPLPEASQGLPFVFDTFDFLGKTTPDVALGAEPSSERPRFSPSKRGKELPLDGAVVRFP